MKWALVIMGPVLGGIYAYLGELPLLETDSNLVVLLGCGVSVASYYLFHIKNRNGYAYSEEEEDYVEPQEQTRSPYPLQQPPKQPQQQKDAFEKFKEVKSGVS